MKNVMYFYNGIQSEEELHDDEVVAKLTEGQMVERAGENWKIVQVETVTVASEPERTDIVKGLPCGAGALDSFAWRNR
jgi:hypothetical protein